LTRHEWMLGADPWSLPPEQRVLLVQLLLGRHVAAAQKRYADAKAAYDSYCSDMDGISRARRVEVLNRAKIIGMTTTVS
jgi:hypothetical protein